MKPHFKFTFVILTTAWFIFFCAWLYTDQVLVRSFETNKRLIEANNVLLKRTSDDEDQLLNLRASNDQLRADSKMWKDWSSMCVFQITNSNAIGEFGTTNYPNIFPAGKIYNSK